MRKREPVGGARRRRDAGALQGGDDIGVGGIAWRFQISTFGILIK